jgi:hypothetical protein
MRIYVGHSRNFDFQKELYEPIRRSPLNKRHEIVLPHEHSNEAFPSSDFLTSCDLMIAEASWESAGLSTELQWAVSFGVPVILAVRKGHDPPKFLKPIAKGIVVYSDSKELIDGLSGLIKQ